MDIMDIGNAGVLRLVISSPSLGTLATAYYQSMRCPNDAAEPKIGENISSEQFTINSNGK